MNIILVKVVRCPMGARFQPNIKYCNETFSKAGYTSQKFAYLCLTFLNSLFLRTGIIPFVELCGFGVRSGPYLTTAPPFWALSPELNH